MRSARHFRSHRRSRCLVFDLSFRKVLLVLIKIATHYVTGETHRRLSHSLCCPSFLSGYRPSRAREWVVVEAGASSEIRRWCWCYSSRAGQCWHSTPATWRRPAAEGRR
jgi:hypothetical protein